MGQILAIVATLLLAASFSAHAVLQASDDSGTTVTLSAMACENKAALAELQGINAALVQAKRPTITVDAMRAATVMYQGKNYPACWVRVGDMVGVIADTGEAEAVTFVVPVAEFRDITPI